ncbi:helix-turn-helix transcriptional regulator [Actinophytocola sp.]|uniref:helix-turn-helix transcriptional regulator n=1 Tax=Actinophytocola sp. TaxID=1872138 RepID=UPI002D7F7F38|nr:helix-turn-helix transcriptional regulator [Actinophytocola sp.]HET9142087.1 helix-turn-helix transcriptional regulator [Actinophytocola sp.]
MQQSSFDPSQSLAERLRRLRRQPLDGRTVTQKELADALQVSAPLISSWESPHNSAIPSEDRLEAIARFFATERSVSQHPFQLVKESQLKAPERARRDALLHELTQLRDLAVGHTDNASRPAGLWRFPDGHVITIVGSELPERLRRSVPYTDPDDPDHVEMYRYSDLDALVEVHGHIRAVNPTSQVYIRPAPELTPDDYTSHLVVLGGVDWNQATAELLARMELPMRQEGREPESEVGGFEVVDRDERKVFRPKLRKVGAKKILVEDVAHFYHGVSPFNVKRTVTICNGMFQRGTYGAVRALTDARFRDRNEGYLQNRFPHRDAFSILFRVLIANGQVVTPDWTVEHSRLHEWPAEGA